MSINDFVKLIQSGKSNEIGIDNLNCLKKILPDRTEVDEIKYFFEANPICLEDLCVNKKAEYFIKSLIDMPSFRLRVESMIYIEEFGEIFAKLKEKFKAYFQVSKAILTSSSLKSFIRLVLLAGNYLNNVTNLTNMNITII